MNLISLVENRITVTAECLMIREFNELWIRDKSKAKETALKEITYVYYVSDYKSVYNNYPLSTKEFKIKEDIIKDSSWQPDDIVKAAIAKYDELQITPTLRMLRGARKALEELTRYYENLRVTDRNIMPASASLEKLGKISESFDKLEDKIKKEIGQEGRNKAGRSINPLEI